MQEPEILEVPEFKPQQSSKTKSILREILETLVLTAIIFFIVNSVTGRFKIFGQSMENTFQSGQYIIVNRLAYRLGQPQRGDVVVFVPPGYPESTFAERLIGLPGETDYIKRIIGIPGDTIRTEGSQLLVNGQVIAEPYIRDPMNSAYDGREWSLGPNQYFALGDNRNASKDSRDPSVGPVDGNSIVGKVWVVYWPVSDWQLVVHYRYP
ncbi:MAG TPA: signal peptidase I [Anaerolineales bacterium]|nr:signal peptidase I [Anaerolineales bacterium]